MKPQKPKPVFLLLLILVLSALACGQTVTPTLNPYGVQRDFNGTGTIFIWAVGNDDEQLAWSLLTEKTQSAVTQYCDGGKIAACFDKIELQSWGTPKDIYFLPDFSKGSTAVYGVSWSTDTPTWVVLEIVSEDGEWRVESWRGFIPSKASEGEIPYGLFDGTDKTNLFPSEQ